MRGALVLNLGQWPEMFRFDLAIENATKYTVFCRGSSAQSSKHCPLPNRALSGWQAGRASYLRAGGKSVQLPCATSAAMPMLSPNVG